MICVVLLLTPNVWRTNESKWFNEINFRVTQFTGYFNDRSKNFTHPECEDHFYPKESPSNTAIDVIAALKLTGLSGLFAMCSCMFVLSLLVFFSEIVLFSHLSHRQILANNSMITWPKKIQFAHKCKCSHQSIAVQILSPLQTCLNNLDSSGLVILSSEAKTIICEDAFEIHISLVLKLNASDQEPVIRNELQALTFHLDGISL